jgi:hypothetical protein
MKYHTHVDPVEPAAAFFFAFAYYESSELENRSVL